MKDPHLFLDELSRVNNELANAQRELAKKNVELERLNAEKTRYLGIAAHDLRTPLAVIQNCTEFLLDDAAANLNREHLGFIHCIRDSSEFLLRLIDDLLDVSAIESGQLRLDVTPGNLDDVINRNLVLHRVLARKRGVSIRFDRPAEPVACVFDASKMIQVLDNLVGNAIKYSPDGGEILVRLRSGNGTALVMVRDRGPGIPHAEQTKLFQPFSRAQSPNLRRKHSTGLGLAIARRIVEGHRGRIWLESEPGEGAAFFVELPCP